MGLDTVTSSPSEQNANFNQKTEQDFNSFKDQLNISTQLEKWPKNFKLQFEVRRMEKKFKDVESELTRLLAHFSLLNQMREPISEFPEEMVKSIYKNYQTAEKNMKTVKNEITLLSERVDLTIKQVFQSMQSCKETMARLSETEKASTLNDKAFTDKIQHILSSGENLEIGEWFPKNDQLAAYSCDELEQILSELQNVAQDSKTKHHSLGEELESLQSKYRVLLQEVQDLSSSLERKKYNSLPDGSSEGNSGGSFNEKLCENTAEITAIISAVSGAEVKSVTNSRLRVLQTVVSSAFIVDFELDEHSESSAVTRVSLSDGNLDPVHISIDDISAVCVSKQDIGFGLREVRDRIWCFFQRVDQLEGLRSKYPCKWDSDATHAEVTLPGGIIFSFRLNYNYPMRNAFVKLVDISFMKKTSGAAKEALLAALDGLNSRRGQWAQVGTSLPLTIDQLLITLNSSDDEEEEDDV